MVQGWHQGGSAPGRQRVGSSLAWAAALLSLGCLSGGVRLWLMPSNAGGSEQKREHVFGMLPECNILHMHYVGLGNDAKVAEPTGYLDKANIKTIKFSC